MAYAYQREARTEFFYDRAEFARDYAWLFLPSAWHRLNHVLTYQIPVGKGRWLLPNAHGVTQGVAGGWQLTTTSRWYSGRLLQFGQSLSVSGTPLLDSPERGRWFNTGV